MIKSYPSIGPIFLVLFLIVIGIWMTINPMLENPETVRLNYGGLFFTALGFGLIFTAREITVSKDQIEIKQMITGKKKTIPKSGIMQIIIEEDKRSYWERRSTGQKKHRSRITVEFKADDIPDLIFIPLVRSSYFQARDFFRENYDDLVIEHEHNFE
jgi:hypothetical protein